LRTKRTTLSWSTVAMADDEESFGSDDDLRSSSSEEEEAHGEVLLPRSGSLHRANGRCSSLNGTAPVLQTGVLPLQRLEQIQSNRKSALMHTGVLSVLLDAGGVPKIRAVITSVRSSG
jgi:hypothetical protein